MTPALRTTLGTAFWVLLADQVTKYVVVHALDLSSRLYFDLIPGVIGFRMAWNRGVNFGLFSGFDMRWVLVAVALAISIGVLVWIARGGGSRWTQLSAGLLVGGAIGNLVDRLLYGAVADFLNVTCCGIDNPYAFNVADIAIFLGAVGLIFFAGGPEEGPGGKTAGGGKAVAARRTGPKAKATRTQPKGQPKTPSKSQTKTQTKTQPGPKPAPGTAPGSKPS